VTIPDFRIARRLSPEEADRLENVSPVGDFLGGLVVGARRDPLAGFIVDRVTEALPGVGVEKLEELELGLGRSGAAQAGQFIGEWGSLLGIGAGAFGLGRAAVGAVLKTGARGALANSQIAARLIGGSLGVGASEGARELAAGGSGEDAAKAAAIGAALTAGFEGALIGAGRALSPKGRLFDRAGPREQFVERARSFTEGQVGGVGRDAAGRPVLSGKLGELSKLRGRLAKVTGELRYQEELANPRQVPLFADDVAQAAGKAEQGVLFAGAERAGRSKLEALRGRARRLEQRVAQKSTEVRALRGFAQGDVTLDARILQPGPSPVGEGQLQEARQLLRQVTNTPERYASKLGVTATRALQLFEDKEVTMEAIRRPQNLARLGKLLRELGDEFGIDVRPFMHRGEVHLDKVGSALVGVFDDFERGVRHGGRKDVLFDQLDDLLKSTYEPLAKMGAQPLQTAEELARKGTQRYLPHVMKDLPEARKRAVLEAVLRRDNPTLPLQEIQARAANIMSLERDFGVRSIGSVEYERVLGGTLKSKIEAGLMEDPATSIWRYLNSVAEREEIAKRFGFNGELRGAIVEMARQEGADPGAVGSLLDHFLHRKWEPHARRRLAQSVTSLQSALKLTLAALPNVTQPANNALAFGFRSSLAGVRKALIGGRKGIGAEVMGLLESEFGMMNRAMSGVQEASLLDRFAQATLKYSGFTRTEGFARLASANAGAYFIEKEIARGVTGRLRGPARDLARRRLAELGIDLERVLREGGARMAAGEPTRAVVDSVLGADVFAKGVYRAAQMTQFIPGSTKIPLAWQSSLGRVLLQFKGFALNQGKLVRDTVLAEAARGNLGPLGAFLAIYPLSGELVAGSLAAIKGRPREAPQNPIVRLLDDATYLGAGGLVQSALINAQYGRLGDFLIGPTASDFVGLSEALYQSAAQFDPSPLGKAVGRQPLLKTFGRAPALVGAAAAVGLAGIDQMEDLLGSIEAGPEQPAIGMDEFREGFRQ